MSNCTSCNRPITWAVAQASGKSVPLDPTPIPDGNVVRVGADEQNRPIVVFLKKGETSTNPRYRSHFTTCPAAQRHRKPKQPARVKVEKPPPAPTLFGGDST